MENLEEIAVEIPLGEAMDFLESHGGATQKHLGKNPRAWGAMRGDEPIAIIIFSNPLEKTLQSSFTRELACLAFKNGLNRDPKIEVALITSFIATDPWDFFTREKISKETCKLLQLRQERGLHQWHNPRIKFYTYRISSNESGEYYFGRHSIAGDSITESDCMVDSYMGSGGKAYREWKTHHKKSLQKDVLGIFSTWGEVVRAERELIGNFHLTDPLCLNSQPGGTGLAKVESTLGNCSTHGITKHLNGRCVKCFVGRSFSLEKCPIHGESWHSGKSCRKCVGESTVSLRVCEIHGEVSHRENRCLKCSRVRTEKLLSCRFHGESKHQGDRCLRCLNEANYESALCPTHGESKHRGGNCAKCVSELGYRERECATHGSTLHHGNSCQRCVRKRASRVSLCEKHGESNFQGNSCRKCVMEASYVVKECATHGSSKHSRHGCLKCSHHRKKN